MPRDLWEYRQVGVVLPIEQVRAMFVQAREQEARAGGRFYVSETTVVVGALANPHDWVGRLCVWWELPTVAQAVIWQVAWNPACSGAKQEVLDAVAQLLGAQCLADLAAVRPLLEVLAVEDQSEPTLPAADRAPWGHDEREGAEKEAEDGRQAGFPVYEHAARLG